MSLVYTMPYSFCYSMSMRYFYGYYDTKTLDPWKGVCREPRGRYSASIWLPVYSW